MSDPLDVRVFLTLAAMAWIDGEVAPPEAEAILSAARSSGLDEAACARVEQATREPTDFEDGLGDLSPVQRLFVYALARWIAVVDGEVAPLEGAALDAVGHILGVTRRGRDTIHALVDEHVSHESELSHLEVKALRAEIQQRFG